MVVLEDVDRVAMDRSAYPTNPILFEDSPEREAVLRAGVDVAYDGLEFEL